MYTCQSHDHCISEAVEKAEIICGDNELRFTPLRKRVLKLVWESHRPAKAYDILDKLKTEDPAAKPSTVYRTLDFLLENGLIHKLNSLNAFVGCSHPIKRHECYFLICSRCGEAKECCDPDLAKATLQTAAKNEFQTRRITLEIEGICRQCGKISSQ